MTCNNEEIAVIYCIVSLSVTCFLLTNTSQTIDGDTKGGLVNLHNSFVSLPKFLEILMQSRKRLKIVLHGAVINPSM